MIHKSDVSFSLSKIEDNKADPVATFSLRLMGQFFRKLFEDWRSAHYEKRATITCLYCRQQFIAGLQTGLCPHQTLEEFVEELLKAPIIDLTRREESMATKRTPILKQSVMYNDPASRKAFPEGQLLDDELLRYPFALVPAKAAYLRRRHT